MLAEEPPSIARVHETRPRGSQGSSSRRSRARGHTRQPLDDWLGDISDEDWSEDATRRAERRRATSADEELPVPEDDPGRGHTAERPAPTRPVAAAEAHRAAVERRRLVAGLVLVVVVALAAAIAVLLLRGGSGGSQAQTTPVARAHRHDARTDGDQSAAGAHHSLDDDADDHAIDARRLHLHPPRGHEAPAR